jgi:hypothetical protein
MPYEINKQTQTLAVIVKDDIETEKEYHNESIIPKTTVNTTLQKSRVP